VLFEATGRDGAAIRRMMGNLTQQKRFEIDKPVLETLRKDFDAAAVDEATIAGTIGRTWNEAGYLLDPHTAIGVDAARSHFAEGGDASVPMVVLGTAHPAKFPAAVKAASSVTPALPAHLSDLMAREERFTRLPNTTGDIERFIRGHARATKGAVA
jgi:threonine synthase